MASSLMSDIVVHNSCAKKKSKKSRKKGEKPENRKKHFSQLWGREGFLVCSAVVRAVGGKHKKHTQERKKSHVLLTDNTDSRDITTVGDTDAGHRGGFVNITRNCKIKVVRGSCCEKGRNHKHTSTVIHNETADAQMDVLAGHSIEPGTLFDVDATGRRDGERLFGLEIAVGPGVGVNHTHSQGLVRQVVDKVNGMYCATWTGTDWVPP